MRKRSVRYLLTIAALMAALSISAFADVMGGTVTGNSVNIRDDASTSGRWLMTAPKDANLVIFGKSGNWYNVSYNGKIGYMCADYVEPKLTAEGDFGYATVTGSYVNVRQKPTTTSTAIQVLTQGITVKIKGVQDGWFMIEYDGVCGYMHPDYLESIAVAEAVSTRKVKTEGERIVETAMKYIGIKYVWGGSTPKQGFDCSGLTQYVFNECGYKIRYRTQQYLDGQAVKYSQLEPGDLVFFATNGNGKISHVGIYIGNGQFIHAPKPGKTVTITDMSSGYYKNTFVCARRIVD